MQDKAQEELLHNPQFLPLERVEPVIRKISTYYNVSTDRIAQALQTRVQIVDEQELLRELRFYYQARFTFDFETRVLQEMRRNMEKMIGHHSLERVLDYQKDMKAQVEQMRLELQAHAEEEAAACQGIHIPWLNRIMMVGKYPETFDHEELHALGQNEDGSTGFMSPLGDYRTVNEAATTLMAVHHQTGLPIAALRNQVGKGRRPVSYRDEVHRLAACLELTERGQNPFSVQELASHYFTKPDKRPKAVILREEIENRIPSNLRMEAIPLVVDPLFITK